MKDHRKVLIQALQLREKSGGDAKMQIRIDRLPASRYIQFMKPEPRRGPFGKIIEIEPTGTVVEYTVNSLIDFLCREIERAERMASAPVRKRHSRMNNVRAPLNAVVSKAHLEDIRFIAEKSDRPVSHVIDDCMDLYIKTHMRRFA